MTLRFLIILLTVLVLITGTARASDLTEKETRTARKLYLSKCAKCHKLYDPTNYKDAEWDTWMAKMRKKARLKADDAELLSRYLNVIRGKGDSTDKDRSQKK